MFEVLCFKAHIIQAEDRTYFLPSH